MNDEFKAEGTLIKSFEMYVYDNWGNLVWKADDMSKGWDGRYKGQEAPEGVYTFKATSIDTNNKENNYQGQIKLIR
jgi:gliding motility-associated-like protein